MASGATELRTGVRRGAVSALDALLYHCADGMYAMALTALPDERMAQDAVREAWRRMLTALQGARFERDQARRLWRITEDVLAERLDRATARAARRAVTGEDGSVGLEGVRLSREVLEELSALSAEHAETIRAHWRLRRWAQRGAIVALFAIAVGVWAAVFYQRTRFTGDLAQLKYDCLRERIARQELVSVMREAAFQLDDPTGADKETAADCERVLLVLEEIANSPTLRQISGLRYVRRRVAQHDLAGFVRSLEETFPEMADSLPRVALALEEVENL
jgi:hypothetical protein